MCCATSELRARFAPLLLVLTAGCGITMDVPEPFLRIDAPRSELKATTPDDARIWIRSFGDPDRGDVAFWAGSLEHDLLARGYRDRDDAASVQDGAGRDGRLMTYTVDVDGQSQGYLVAVFVIPGWRSNTVRIVEFVAPEERFAELMPAVRNSLATIRG